MTILRDERLTGKKPRAVVTILFFAAFFGGMFLSFGEPMEPWGNYSWSDTFIEGDPPTTAKLDAGTYEVWCSDNPRNIKQYRSLSISNATGAKIFEAGPENASSEYTFEGRSYKDIGRVKIEQGGRYNIKVEGSAIVYLREPQEGGIQVPLCMVTALIGGVLGAAFHYGFGKPYYEKRMSEAWEAVGSLFRR